MNPIDRWAWHQILFRLFRYQLKGRSLSVEFRNIPGLSPTSVVKMCKRTIGGVPFGRFGKDHLSTWLIDNTQPQVAYMNYECALCSGLSPRNMPFSREENSAPGRDSHGSEDLSTRELPVGRFMFYPYISLLSRPISRSLVIVSARKACFVGDSLHRHTNCLSSRKVPSYSD